MIASQAFLWIGIAIVLGLAAPVAFMAMLAPRLAESGSARRQNCRGRPVFLGLGVAWLVWAASAIIAGGLVGMMSPQPSAPFAAGILVVAGPLALVAFALGMVDDALGSDSDRGFTGHLGALRRGRMTTGMLKLVGISLASLVCCVALADVAPWGRETRGDLWAYAAILGAGAAVALTSNLMNLVDLRPGRALKLYLVLALAGAALAGWFLAVPASIATTSAQNSALAVVVLAIFALGPVVAVWRFDLGERGMLGDAGANPMGAVAGLMVIAGLPLWGLLVYLGVVLALNLASERVSFSRVIESNPFLRGIDELGRLDDRVAGEKPRETGPAHDTPEG